MTALEPTPAQRLAREVARVQELPVDGRRGQARRLARATRHMITRLTATALPAEVLALAAEKMAEVSAVLAGPHPARGYEDMAGDSGVVPGPGFFDWSPQCGLANPLAPPMHVDVEADRIVGRAFFGAAYEGPPGCVHGGCIAGAFDEVLGLAQSLSGQAGLTGTLTVRYRRPTPLNTEVRFEAWVDEVKGRKVLTAARLWAGEQVTAEATGLFVVVGPARLRSMWVDRNRQPGR
jgi:acyl-coenzyme A thioesterase PaaI-like protein